MKILAVDESLYVVVPRAELNEYLDYPLSDEYCDTRSDELHKLLAAAPIADEARDAARWRAIFGSLSPVLAAGLLNLKHSDYMEGPGGLEGWIKRIVDAAIAAERGETKCSPTS